MNIEVKIVIALYVLIINTAAISNSLRDGNRLVAVLRTCLSVLAAWLLIFHYIPAYGVISQTYSQY